MQNSSAKCTNSSKVNREDIGGAPEEGVVAVGGTEVKGTGSMPITWRMHDERQFASSSGLE
jgi:hypothetical protein